MGEITFLDYDKISDTIMYLSKTVTLNFCVSLTRRNTNTNKIVPFHSEYIYNSDYKNKKCYSIKRNFNAYFIINDYNDYNNSVMIRPQDIVFLQMLLQNNVIPWFIGSKRIFSIDSDGKIIIKGKYSPAEFPVSEYKYISMLPIIITYEDGTLKEGIRMIINNKNNFIDMDINKFMEFYYYICNTDIYCAATNLLNYVKIGPYGMNQSDIGGNSFKEDYYSSNQEWNEQKDSGKRNNFFDSL